MNGKQAKRLRKAAMGLAVTLDQAGRKIEPNGYVVKEHKNSASSMNYSSASSISSSTEPEEAPQPKAPSLQIFNKPLTLRSIYRQIKKGVVSGKIPQGAMK